MRAPGFLLVLAVAATLGAAAVPGTASAADDAVTRKKVQTYLDLASDLFKSGDFEGALGELRRAEALSELAVVRYNIARCLEELRRDAEAVAAFEKYLSLKDSNDGAAERQKRAKEAVARLSARSFGAIEVNCPIEGSSVLVVGLMQIPEQCPWKGDKIKPGAYDVQTFSPGFPPYAAKVQVKPGETVAVIGQGGDGKPPSQPAVSQPTPPAQPPEGPSTSQPAPAANAQPPPSDRPVAEPVPATTTPGPAVVTVQPEVAPVRPLVERQTTTHSAGKIIGGTLLGVVAVGSLVGMGYFMADGAAHTDNIKKGGLATVDDILAESQAGSDDNLLAVVFGIVGAGTLIPAIVLLATSGSTTTTYEPSTAVTIAPAAFPSGGGLVLSGTLP